MASLVAWSHLPQELLSMISNLLLPFPSDVCRFRSVCSSWRSSTPPLEMSLPFPDVFIDKLLGCLRLYQTIIYCIEPLVNETSSPSPSSYVVGVRVVRDKLYYVDSLTGLPLDCTMYNQLPKKLNLSNFRITELKRFYGTELKRDFDDEKKVKIIGNKTQKAVFISTQHYNETMLAILVFGTLVFYKLENNEWVMLKDMDNMKLIDIELYQGRLWGVGFDACSTVVFSSALDAIQIGSRLSDADSFLLIESCGDLFVVKLKLICQFGRDEDELVPAKAHKLIVEEKRWVVVKHLDDRVFVIAMDFPWCFSLPYLQSRDDPEGIRKNCIIRSAGVCEFYPTKDDSDDLDYDFLPMEYAMLNIRAGKRKFRSYGRELFVSPPSWLYTENSLLIPIWEYVFCHL